LLESPQPIRADKIYIWTYQMCGIAMPSQAPHRMNGLMPLASGPWSVRRLIFPLDQQDTVLQQARWVLLDQFVDQSRLAHAEVSDDQQGLRGARKPSLDLQLTDGFSTCHCIFGRLLVRRAFHHWIRGCWCPWCRTSTFTMISVPFFVYTNIWLLDIARLLARCG
jgi:hypothetical protein